ncbi:MAG: peptidoglycan-associated lipoprotein Pal [Gammaproteobacteria bacterium]|nr:peptidoglycan-associated lipoprotein Pal [Gammaproteobacteria bacterium]
MHVANGLKKTIIVGALVMLAACSKTHGNYEGGYGDEASANGLGQFTHFPGQRAGESYTTQAPHNQLYLFSYDDSVLNPKYEPSLHAQADYIKSHPGARVMIAGHTDERGSREYNVALGERRANAVADVLKMEGVSPQQMRVVSYGKERPINTGHDADSHAQNRRAEFLYEATK